MLVYQHIIATGNLNPVNLSDVRRTVSGTTDSMPAITKCTMDSDVNSVRLGRRPDIHLSIIRLDDVDALSIGRVQPAGRRLGPKDSTSVVVVNEDRRLTRQHIVRVLRDLLPRVQGQRPDDERSGRDARRTWRTEQASAHAGLPDSDADTTLVFGHWGYLGSGYSPGAPLLAADVWHRRELQRHFAAEGGC
ncbi:hypothetical protein [Streptomyces sp. NPDC088910]|uniref:hypothetical protein n=1 Tax=Streptomyces sp. NPDC088910 TaxID=3365911 RepID=UPI003806F835